MGSPVSIPEKVYPHDSKHPILHYSGLEEKQQSAEQLAPAMTAAGIF
jgi:hypothetical protein